MQTNTITTVRTTYVHSSNPIKRRIKLRWLDEGKVRTKTMPINVSAVDEHAAAIRAAFPDAAIVMVDNHPAGYVYEVQP